MKTEIGWFNQKTLQSICLHSNVKIMGYTFIQTAQKIKQFFKRVILNLLSTLNKKIG